MRDFRIHCTSEGHEFANDPPKMVLHTHVGISRVQSGFRKLRQRILIKWWVGNFNSEHAIVVKIPIVRMSSRPFKSTTLWG